MIVVYGLAIAGAATVRALQARGEHVVAVDDRIDAATRAVAADLDVELIAPPDDAALGALVAAADLVVPAPGVPETHRLFPIAAATGSEVVSELELAYRWEQERPGGPRPMLAVTGTDGKTTTTLLAVDMLAAGGLRSVAAGNTDVPLVEALDLAVDVFVVECTSFRLAWTREFRADVAAWLNLAPDHLNWHTGMDSYIAAKARMFDQQRSDDVAIGAVADPIVMAHLAVAPARHRTFGLRGADYEVRGSGPDAVLTGPQGELAAVASMRRALPHDRTNGLAAAALVLERGLVTPAAVAAALASFTGPPHRIELVADAGGVRWYNDSKATTPHAASTAIRAFDHVVLIAGGLNKGLDLAPMAAEPQRLRGVVAIGEAADLIAATFAGAAPIVRADTMADAVERAGALAEPGDVVLLSPGCASFDWYPAGGYPARGDDFRRLVRERVSIPHGAEAPATSGAGA
ncbi:MAG: UDP-N-acetylmuramoyl-L-alanine--D-glutamate ligase [Ilumatobacteraceae bacterium]